MKSIDPIKPTTTISVAGGPKVMVGDLPSLKRAYNKAIKDEQETFMFKDTKLLTKYAGYLIEYLIGMTK